MKRMLKSICCLMLLFAMSFTIVGCSNNNDTTGDNTTKNETDNTDDTDDLKDIDSKVNTKFTSDYKVSRDDVNEAVTYIHDHIDEVKDDDIAKKLYEQGSYLEKAADEGKVDDDNDIRKLGENTKEYVRNVYDADDGEIDDIISKGKVKFDEFKNSFDNGVDTTIDNFMDFFK